MLGKLLAAVVEEQGGKPKSQTEYRVDQRGDVGGLRRHRRRHLDRKRGKRQLAVY